MEIAAVAKPDIGSPGREFGEGKFQLAAGRDVDIKAGYEQQVLVAIGWLAPGAAIGPIELDLGMIARGIERRMGRGDQRRHRGAERGLEHVLAFRCLRRGAPEEKQVGGQVRTDQVGLVAPNVRGQAVDKIRCGTKGFRADQYLERVLFAILAEINQRIEVYKQPLGPAFVKQLIVDKNRGPAVKRAAPDVLAGMTIFLLVPMQYGAELAAIVAKFLAARPLTLVDAEPLCVGVVTNVTRLDDDQVFAVMGMRGVPVGGDLAADPAAIERKGPEMLGNQNDWIALALVGAERPRRHHSFALKSERQAVIVKPRNELAVAHRAIVNPEILADTAHEKEKRRPDDAGPLPLRILDCGCLALTLRVAQNRWENT